MTRLPRLAVIATAAALSAVLLAGCSGGGTPAATVTVTAPAPTATATVTSTPTEDPVAAKAITLNADGISVTAPEGTILAGYFDGAQPAIDALTAVLGTVQPTFLAAGKCNADQTTYDWGSLQLTYLGSDASADKTFTLYAKTAPTSVDVTTALGASVGDTWSTYIAKVPSSQPTRDDGTYTSVLESVTPGGESSTEGTVVTATNGVITAISVPQDFNADC
ncbi:hypothetical protein [Subtercola sp. YIM 133946]|uniref:hypothetical protein n=1 Tax=Subtercola sp. YIM 133946 TaxID=3118909 RepID=UPI002F9324A8